MKNFFYRGIFFFQGAHEERPFVCPLRTWKRMFLFLWEWLHFHAPESMVSFKSLSFSRKFDIVRHQTYKKYKIMFKKKRRQQHANPLHCQDLRATSPKCNHHFLVDQFLESGVASRLQLPMQLKNFVNLHNLSY